MSEVHVEFIYEPEPIKLAESVQEFMRHKHDDATVVGEAKVQFVDQRAAFVTYYVAT